LKFIIVSTVTVVIMSRTVFSEQLQLSKSCNIPLVSV
jgi:hypothetical protein